MWTNQPCADGKVLHEGVGAAAQNAAERADRVQRAQRERDSAAAAKRLRESAYDSRSPRSTSTKNLERCDTTRRSLRIERSKTLPDFERIRQLTSDERKWC